jgi:pimeloyl-ACP methyl ester carboxylesterase
MAIHVNNAPVTLNADSLHRAFPSAGKRLCLFIHGLSCDEHCWENESTGADGNTDNFGTKLHAEFDCTPLYLRYNSGLSIADNGAQLAVLLEELLAAWPQPACELLIIGHSMGGLIALSALHACQQPTANTMTWPQAMQMLICLGSPNLGSPVEQIGHWLTAALHLTQATAPLGKIAATRSQGIKDLRHGPGAPRHSAAHHHIAFRFLGASLTEDTGHPFCDFFGDGLVTLGSATTHQIEGDVQSARLGNIGHMALTTDPRVYRQIREWLAGIK